MIRFRRGIIYAISIVVLSAIFGWIVAVMPALAQTRSTAFITLDGRQVFEVSQSGQFDADNRASDAHLILQDAVRSNQPAKVEIVTINQLPVI